MPAANRVGGREQ